MLTITIPSKRRSTWGSSIVARSPSRRPLQSSGNSGPGECGETQIYFITCLRQECGQERAGQQEAGGGWQEPWLRPSLGDCQAGTRIQLWQLAGLAPLPRQLARTVWQSNVSCVCVCVRVCVCYQLIFTTMIMSVVETLQIKCYRDCSRMTLSGSDSQLKILQFNNSGGQFLGRSQPQ